jgi:hypothetical protein
MLGGRLKINLLVGLSLLFLAGFLGWRLLAGFGGPAIESPSLASPSALLLEKQQELVTLAIDFGDGRRQVMTAPAKGDNLFELTKNLAAAQNLPFFYQTYPGLGELVTQIGDLKNGFEGKYWQFWINGAYSQVGASSYKPRAGDMIEWKFTNERP